MSKGLTRQQKLIREKGRHFSERTDGLCEEILDAMLDLTWVSGRSHVQLAKKYKLAPETIYGYATQVSRFIRLCGGRKREIQDRIMRAIDLGQRLSLEAERIFLGPDGIVKAKQPNLAALRDFLQMQIDIHGFGRVASSVSSREGARSVPQVDADIEDIRNVLSTLGYVVTKKEANRGTSDGSEDQ